MIPKTCLIVGAGGSVPYGLPSGADLRDLIVMSRSKKAKPTALRYPVLHSMPSQGYFDSQILANETDFKRKEKQQVLGIAILKDKYYLWNLKDGRSLEISFFVARAQVSTVSFNSMKRNGAI